MRLHDGLWWPESDMRARGAITRDLAAILPVLLDMVPARACVVQAGGNAGLYPLRLSEYFERVITFEPDADNFECLSRNAPESVERYRAALGADIGLCHVVVVEPDNCGAHKTEPGGDVLVMTVDDLNLSACDLIWLDVEGSEAEAIDGARKTIARFSPVIVLEEKGLGAKAILDGYEAVTRVGNDTIYRKA